MLCVSKAFLIFGIIPRHSQRSDFSYRAGTVECNPTDYWCGVMLIKATVNSDAAFRYEISTTLDRYGIGRVRQGENAISTLGRYSLCRFLHRDDRTSLKDR